mmetsp:Transcript_5252/g.11424  ORF Transcript_5252/g.11424 Transcript_5252/m.11424 type:complete len:929 (-) Transcript_5252:902-3688(-)
MSDHELLYLRDLADIEPPRERYKAYDSEDIYKFVPKPQWTGLEDEIWTPRAAGEDPQLDRVKALMSKQSRASSVSERLDMPLRKSVAGHISGRFAIKGKRRRSWSEVLRDVLNNKWLEAGLVVATLWALFAEDGRYSLERPAASTGDVVFYALHLAVASIFTIELLLRSIVQRGYANSFFFWLDIIAIGSMIFDFLPLFQSNDSGAVDTNASDAARAGRAARAGTKVGRLLRLLRIVRVLKLFLASKKRKHDKLTEVKEYTPSELGKELKNRITQKSILFVLILLLGSALFEFVLDKTPVDLTSEISSGQLYLASNASATDGPFNAFGPDGAIDRNSLGGNFSASKGQFTNQPFFFMRSEYEKQFVRYFPFGIGQQNLLLRLEMYNLTYFYPSDPDDPEWKLNDDPAVDPFLGGFGGTEYPNCGGDVFDDDELVVEECPHEIYHLRANLLERTVTILTLAPYTQVDPTLPEADESSSSSFSFSSSSSSSSSTNLGTVWISRRPYVLSESYFSMFFTVCVCFLLGLMGFLFSRDAELMVIRPIETMVDSVTKLAANPAYKLEQVKQIKYETDALYVSLAKIAALLQVGFGEAGNHLVAENLKKGDTVDPMVPGTKLLGAFGFCIIDDYEEVLECLGEEILPFTNTAAEIVHKAVVDNGGQPNRNLGEAFLCVWKPRAENAMGGGVDGKGTSLSPAQLKLAENKMCDGALTAFRSAVRGVQSSIKLQAYNSHEEVLKYFNGTYKTVIGYGLHYGYAIEGAVGTNIKIDCSYLSPNVNLAARLESATRMYGVTILMSEHFVSRLSRATKVGLRRVDVVCLKGSSIPMAIYTCDRSNALYCTPRAVAEFGEGQVVAEFQRRFEAALDLFVSGDWRAAKVGFEGALAICPHDKPSKRLLWHMDAAANRPDYGLATTPFVAPDGWPGFHILLSK